MSDHREQLQAALDQITKALRDSVQAIAPVLALVHQQLVALSEQAAAAKARTRADFTLSDTVDDLLTDRHTPTATEAHSMRKPTARDETSAPIRKLLGEMDAAYATYQRHRQEVAAALGLPAETAWGDLIDAARAAVAGRTTYRAEADEAGLKLAAVRKLADGWAVLRTHGGAAYELLAILDNPAAGA